MEVNTISGHQEQDIAKNDPNSTITTIVADTDSGSSHHDDVGNEPSSSATPLGVKEQSTVQNEDAILSQAEPHSKQQDVDLLDGTSSTNTPKAKEKSNCCYRFFCLSRHDDVENKSSFSDITLGDEEQSTVQNEDVTIPSTNLSQTEPHIKEQDVDELDGTSPTNTPKAKENIIFDKCKVYLRKAWNVTGIYLFLFDQGTDIYAAYRHIVNGDIYWGCLTILFFSLPIIVTYVKDTYKDIQDCDKRKGTVSDKWFLGISGFFMAPIRPFYLIVDNVVNNLKDKEINPKALRNIWIIKLLEALLESLPQAGLQLYVILLRGTPDIWQWITVATSLLALSFMISTNTYLFKLSTPAKSRAVFFFLGIITVLSRLAVFAVYVGIGKQLQINILWLLPLATMLFVSISVWVAKRFCIEFINGLITRYFKCCKTLKPLSEVGHHIQIRPHSQKKNIAQNDQNSTTITMASKTDNDDENENSSSATTHGDEKQSTVQNEGVNDNPDNTPKAKEKSNCFNCCNRKQDIAQNDPKSTTITIAPKADGLILPDDDDENERSSSAVAMCWVLTAAYNSFTKSGLLISTLNFILAIVSVHLEANLTKEKPFESVLIIIPATFSLVTNLILVLIPYFTEGWNIGDDWLNIDEEDKTMLY